MPCIRYAGVVAGLLQILGNQPSPLQLEQPSIVHANDAIIPSIQTAQCNLGI